VLGLGGTIGQGDGIGTSQGIGIAHIAAGPRATVAKVPVVGVKVKGTHGREVNHKTLAAGRRGKGKVDRRRKHLNGVNGSIDTGVAIGGNQHNIIGPDRSIGIADHLARANPAITKGPLPGVNIGCARAGKSEQLTQTNSIIGKDGEVADRQVKDLHLPGKGVAAGVFIVHIQADIIDARCGIGVIQHIPGVKGSAITHIPVPVLDNGRAAAKKVKASTIAYAHTGGDAVVGYRQRMNHHVMDHGVLAKVRIGYRQLDLEGARSGKHVRSVLSGAKGGIVKVPYPVGDSRGRSAEKVDRLTHAQGIHRKVGKVRLRTVKDLQGHL